MPEEEKDFAAVAVDAIINDLCDRRGLKQEFLTSGVEVRAEIRATWEEKIRWAPCAAEQHSPAGEMADATKFFVNLGKIVAENEFLKQRNEGLTKALLSIRGLSGDALDMPIRF